MGSTILTIGLSFFRKLKIGCPRDKVEQSAISSRLKSTDRFLDSLASELAKLRQKKSGLMHDLLTGEVALAVESESQANLAHA
jgi:type I restriction enzyme S subunit